MLYNGIAENNIRVFKTQPLGVLNSSPSLPMFALNRQIKIPTRKASCVPYCVTLLESMFSTFVKSVLFLHLPGKHVSLPTEKALYLPGKHVLYRTYQESMFCTCQETILFTYQKDMLYTYQGCMFCTCLETMFCTYQKSIYCTFQETEESMS